MLKFCSPYGKRREFLVNLGSKAAQRGVREGDLITSINGEGTTTLTNNEAHSLLKRSGSTLKLGLNEDIEGSPKARQFRTIHQETHEQTVKRSSVSYSLKETIERSPPRRQRDNEFEAFKTYEFINGRDSKQNGRDITVVTNIPVSQKSTPSSSSASTPSTLVPEGRNISSDHALASRQSSYSNCSSTPDEGQQQYHHQDPDSQEMNDGQERMSQSKKRRQRRKHLLNRSTSHESQGKNETKIVELEQNNLTQSRETTGPDIKLEPSSPNKLDILRLKRIEHKYKVESPKELKLEHSAKSSHKKLKAKSKSLDDDDVKIQELSEASESEDGRYQSNVVISEASSEENLLDDSDCESQRKRKALNSITLQLNDDNQIEALSHISPAEEHELRSFLGGLNLVNSPEESAKDLYERTSGLTDSKAKKQQKRKELEEYFVPIAQNPRFLDAISEEASDISDKECGSSSKSIPHLKQGTPVQDIKSNSSKRSPDRLELEKPILVETNAIEPLQESICSTTIAPSGGEKAEVVYIDDSSSSSHSSGYFEDAIEENYEETNANDNVIDHVEASNKNINTSRSTETTVAGSKEKTTNGSKMCFNDKCNNVERLESLDLQDNKINCKSKPPNLNINAPVTGNVITDDNINKHYDLHVGSQESMSTVLSSHTKTSTKISKSPNNSIESTSINDSLIFSQLTPPPTPEGMSPKANKTAIPVASNITFDYTKVPNILKEKEHIKENGTKHFKNESLENRTHSVSIKSGGTIESSKECSKLKYEVCNEGKIDSYTTNKNVNSENTEAKSLTTTHISKETVNGDSNVKFRKVQIDEVSRNGDVEVKKGFEEYEHKDNEDSKVKIMDDNVANGSTNNDVIIVNDDFNLQNTYFIETDKDCNQIRSNNDASSTQPSNSTFQESTNVTDSNIIESTSGDSESFISESKKESVLKQIIMTSHGSNKTDSQKLIEFESIRMLNNELKDKISRQELIGPTFRKSRSPSNFESSIFRKSKSPMDFGGPAENAQNTVIMRQEEELPDKKFVQKRIKEFSSQHCNFAEEEIHSNNLGIYCLQPPTETNSLIQSRMRTFSDSMNEETNQCEESVLKRIILANNTNNNGTETNSKNQEIIKGTKYENFKIQKKDVEQLADSKEAPAKLGRIETDVSITLEEENNDSVASKDEGSILKRILGFNTNHGNKSNLQETDTNNSEVIIPIKIEQSKENIIPMELDRPKYNTEQQNPIETIVPIKTEHHKNVTKTVNKNEEIVERVIPIKIVNQNSDKINTEKKTTNNMDSKMESKEVLFISNEIEANKKTEKNIPIKIENQKSYYKGHTEERTTNTVDLNTGSKERLIPIQIEVDKNTGNTIPIKINQQNSEKTQEKKSLNIVDLKMGSNKTLIPIEIENTGKTVPIKITNQNSNIEHTDAQTTDTVDLNMGTKERLISNKIDKNENIENTNKKEQIIPIQIETNSNISQNISKPANDFTKQDLQNINQTLKNILEKKEENKEEQSKSEPAYTNIQNEIQKPGPPIPPPRRSKALLLKKRNEVLNSEIVLDTAVSTETENVPLKKDCRDGIPVSSDMTYSNVLSPPRPASASSDSSGSEEGSRCTAKYNPNSSIADVLSLTKEEECGELKSMYEPISLRSIVLKVLMNLPFGDEILRELSDVSKTIERFTNRLPFKTIGNTNNNVLVEGQEDKMPGSWYTETDVARNAYEDGQKKIVELHKKFLTRRKYNEGSEEHKHVMDDDSVIITGIDTRESQVMSPNRLLTIIREEPSESEIPSEFLYFEDNSDQRLNAKNLGEWLTLARHKSKSTSNLDCTNIPINNLRRTIASTQNEQAKFSNTRRRSLPQEIYEKQLIDIMEKERQIQRELEELEEEKRKLRAELAPSRQKEFQVDDFYVSRKGDFAERRDEESGNKKERPASMPVFPTEFFRQQMYEEYMDKFSERQDRKQQKVIKISSSNDLNQDRDVHFKSKEIIHPIEIEQEFMDRVKEKLKKENRDASLEELKAMLQHDVATSEDLSSDEAPVIVLDGDKVKTVETLPRHLQEFVDDLATQQDDSSIWSPGQPRRPPSPPTQRYQRTHSQNIQSHQQHDPVIPVWTPKSANSSPTVERKEFRAVNFQSPVLSRKVRTRSESIPTPDSTTSEPAWKLPEGSSDTALHLTSTLDRRLPTSQSSPGFGSFSTSPRLPKAQNPTITLLQKAREGQLPRGAHYIDQDRRPPNDRPPIKYPGEVLYHIKNEYTSESDSERPRKMADLASRKFEGIGPTTKDGMPLILRSEVQDKDQSKWYKRMYDTIHKQKPHRDEYVTVRYKQKRAQYPYSSGYLSEPEPGAYDSDFTDYKYQTLDRRRMPQTQHYVSNNSTMPRSVPENRSYSSSDIIKNNQDKYNNQPGRIENYRPGHSSISEKEARQWWDEVMDIFDGHLEQQRRVPAQKPRSFMNQALKESGYESDSTLVFKRKEETAASQISPKEQRNAYKVIQQGGDVPFQGLRKLAPERPKETDLVEFFPISPTLTKIRIHKSMIPSKEFVIPEQEFFCYPATAHHSPKTFAHFKRTAPSSVNVDNRSTPPLIPTPPPSPPKRKSSRNNTTLRLISTMKVRTDRSPICKRHETCFSSGPRVERQKVNFLRDKITCKLSPVTKRKGDTSRLSVVKKISASPELNSKITSTLTTSRDPKSTARKVQSSTKISNDRLQSRGLYKSGSTGSLISKKSSTESLSSRTSTPVRTFGTEKRKFDLTLPILNPKTKLSKTSSEELLSPTEVKKGIKNISASNTQYKESLAMLSSAKLSNESKALPIKVGMTEKGKNILKSSIKRTPNLSPKLSRRSTVQSPSYSTSSERSRMKSSTESLNTPRPISKAVISSLKPKVKADEKKSQHKSKKDEINDNLRQSIKKSANQKCLGKATGADVSKKLMDSIGVSEISQQKQAIESNHFFRNLFFRNIKHSASFTLPKNSWIVEKTNQLTRRRASFQEPSVGAMKIYLKHTRPVRDSKFISLDIIRSRSASPKSVTFSDNIPAPTNGASKRSKSLPNKIVLSQTSRPISPVVTRKGRSPIIKPKSKDNFVTIRRTPSPPKKLVFTETLRPVSPVVTSRQRSPILKYPKRDLVRRSPSPQAKLYFSETSRPVSPEVRRKVRMESPPVSPMLPRSPSCRKIMQLKQQQTYEQNKPHELTLYACPELQHSTTSLDSFRSEDYQEYLKDLVFASDKSDKFKDLNHFYSDIEKVGQLEQKCVSKPRKKIESDIIDYDRWMEVRTRERAEHELKHLYSHLKAHEKEKGFLFLPKDVERYRWKRELDRGLRIKEKSVENIKEEFERLKLEDSERECAKRREMAYSKDTYKPLWRGSSVVNLASTLTERRSQSEGRVKTARQKFLDSERLLTHGIGSRIWSSLSMEQVNILKRQLQEIYADDQPKDTVDSRPTKQYVVDVPKQVERISVPKLTVRRNSESSKHDLMSEDEKKLISQTLSKEVLEKITNRRKEDKLALPLVVGKEVLGARATQEAKVKVLPKKEEQPQKPLVKTNALSMPKQSSVSETESASTDESTKTVINLKDVQQKVEYFEKAQELDTYVPTVHKPAEDGSSNNSEAANSPTELNRTVVEPETKTIHQSSSCQNFKEYFGETDLVKFATLPLSATRKSEYSYTKKPYLRALDISPIRTISEANSIDSLNRSRSASPYCEEAKTLAKKGEVKKLRRQFEFFEDFFGEKKLKRSRSENDLKTYGHVEDLRKKYEYPAYSRRGRSRVKRGGMVSPVWLRAEDRYMPHINIISKIASLYSFSKHRRMDKQASRSMEELAEILGCPVGEVEKMKEKFDKMREHDDQISLMGHMFTSSPNLRELRDITPYLTANWIAHRYPRSEDNTRSLSSPDTSVASRDLSLVRRDRPKSKSLAPSKKGQQQQSILKQVTEKVNQRFENSSRYTKEPDLPPPPPPPPPPKSQGGVRSQEQESPRKYVENEVTIHYKTPVRTEIKDYVSEDELAHRQAEAMKKIYEEERKRKYLQVSKSLQELQDMKSRRHTDNFIPSQKSPISLNRYDDFDDLTTPTKTRTRSPESRLVAKALYNFVGQTARELTFRKGDLIYVRRQVDKNWYEGELNAMVGLFPTNYVEIVTYEGIKTTPRKAHEGQARAKYNFVAQTHLELSLAKGELVTVTRRVDDNWFEGKIGGRKGIFPVAYVDILIDPSEPPPPSAKPVASPAAHSLLLNGSAQGKESMGSHLYTPNIPAPVTVRDNGYHHAKPVQLTGTGTYSTLPKPSHKSPMSQALHIETQSEPIPYRALYKYTPQNDDELELLEGDTVFVLEKCDDGWYVGSSDRTGAFGTFPGNYVEKI